MFLNKLKLLTAVFAVVSIGGVTGYAQVRVNDDLKSETKTVPSETSSKSSVKKIGKSSKKISRQTKSPRQYTNAPTGRTNRTYGGSTVSSTETPDQVINRYMNYQQSSGVTVQDWKRVVAQTAKILQENPNHSTAKAQSLIAQGEIAYNQRSYPAAISYFKSALQILPTSSLPQYSLGKVYLANGQAKAAEQAFKEAINQNEDFALAYKGMGDALVAQGENKKANKFYKKATESSVRKGSLP